MSEYRTTATLTSEGTFVVPGPKDLPPRTRAEVTIRVEDVLVVPVFTGPDPIKEFYTWLERQPPQPSAWKEEQAMVKEMRNEWD